ncbi:GNAT family N-acetyltransferase [Variovorax sp. dw_308]|uniref:GNAT family N-acetyltransferase n=1 Tax=Variovorax sp. dw_308 TaxID=2721546 RepID=UPI001C45C1CB|nr:GNAT family N-acetyltransferase [Variovorax sp. dw_308]
MKVKDKKSAVGVASRAATLLDVPLLFELMMDGSENGAFTDRFLTGTGMFRLMLLIVVGVFRSRWWLGSRGLTAWTMLDAQGETIGFMNTKSGVDGKGAATTVLVHLAFKPEYRNMGFGAAAVKAFLAAQPDGAIVTVYCTKYARAMQHLLKTLRFKRHIGGTPMPFALETYLFAVDRAAGPEPAHAPVVGLRDRSRTRDVLEGADEGFSTAR